MLNYRRTADAEIALAPYDHKYKQNVHPVIGYYIAPIQMTKTCYISAKAFRASLHIKYNIDQNEELIK